MNMRSLGLGLAAVTAFFTVGSSFTSFGCGAPVEPASAERRRALERGNGNVNRIADRRNGHRWNGVDHDIDRNRNVHGDWRRVDDEHRLRDDHEDRPRRAAPPRRRPRAPARAWRLGESTGGTEESGPCCTSQGDFEQLHDRSVHLRAFEPAHRRSATARSASASTRWSVAKTTRAERAELAAQRRSREEEAHSPRCADERALSCRARGDDVVLHSV